MNPLDDPVIPVIASSSLDIALEEPEDGLKVCLLSFGRRVDGGAPSDLDYVFNLTHVPSPSKFLRDRLTGLSKRLQKELFHTQGVDEVYQRVREELLEFILSHFKRKQLRRGSLERKASEEDKAEAEQSQEQKTVYGAATGKALLSTVPNSFRIGFGCDKGLHRSVAFAERLKKELPSLLKTRLGVTLPPVVEVSHLELAQREAQRAEKKRLHKQARSLDEDGALSSEKSDSDDGLGSFSDSATTGSKARLRRMSKGKGNARRFHKHAVRSSAEDD